MALIDKSNRTFSNLLSFSRIFFVIPAVYFISIQRNDLVFWLSLPAMATDYLDGYFARKWNQISELGKILDPLADKINIGGIAIALYLFQGFPLWLTLVIVLRDLGILVGALFIYRMKSRVTPSNIPGKVAVVVVAGTIISFLLGWFDIFSYLIYLVILTILYSAYAYGRLFIKSIGNTANKNR